ncbi:L-2-hydroxyglutarate oxidase [Oceanicoccus sp. KOV_DT_Chl]|uniref:L-2-hydroxyglutarate oxidase n=1 Tax=Oceanicoccus sp. KOV_DT_Chl TaxID=1904639 RepID=UPI000C7AAB66|nr:L-2-hydroxyglutarate oxidase [Oceanicoccus sp. KOV_DT_Chl]
MDNRSHDYDYTVIGGGIVGVATAWQLQQQLPTRSVLLIEKEHALAQHQTGHNSGVIHAGVYYQPGSLKADFCQRGAKATIAFCQQHNIAYQQPGKLLVATSALEYQRLLDLQRRCQQNQLEVEYLDQTALQKLEPNINGLAALRVNDTGIVDYKQLTHVMAQRFRQAGGHVQFNTQLQAAKECPDNIQLRTNQGVINSRYVIACSGLQADRTARLFNIDIDFSIIPFRGEYYQLKPQHRNIVKHLIYPIPDPALPFLGVHLTPMIDGNITVGPNAVLGWKREGYQQWNFSITDSAEFLSFAGFWRLSAQQLSSGLSEFKDSLYKRGYLKRVQKYCSQLSLDDLQPYPAGIRAQAVKQDGSLIHDFLFTESPRSLHVCNAPSPAATSAIPISEYIVNKMLTKTGEDINKPD